MKCKQMHPYLTESPVMGSAIPQRETDVQLSFLYKEGSLKTKRNRGSNTEGVFLVVCGFFLSHLGDKVGSCSLTVIKKYSNLL